jgi:cyclopropane-fatty-acyl-phospholipid synthase
MIAKTIFDQLLSRAQFGPLTVDYWGSEQKQYGTGKSRFTLSIYDEGAVGDIVKRGDLGFGEAYMAGRLDVDHMEELLRFAHLNRPAIEKVLGMGKKSGYHFARNVKRNHANQISSHYDLGNDFYKLWLDDTMTYTCAYFKQSTDSLEMAQRQKIDHVLRKLQLQKGQEFVDIGCGWGHLVIRAAKLYGAKGLGVTLSQEQYKYAVELAKKEGVSKLATFRCMDYLDLKKQQQQYERVVSVGILEHVGRGNLRQYFDVVDHLLVPGGMSVLHSITQQTEEDMPAWIDKYIFPGGYVPALREVVQVLPAYDFHLTDYESLRLHYALTLDEWHRRFEGQLDAVRKQGYDERFIRMWRLYLVGSAAAFRYGTFDLSQLVFTKGLVNDLPLTRAGLYK